MSIDHKKEFTLLVLDFLLRVQILYLGLKTFENFRGPQPCRDVPGCDVELFALIDFVAGFLLYVLTLFIVAFFLWVMRKAPHYFTLNYFLLTFLIFGAFVSVRLFAPCEGILTESPCTGKLLMLVCSVLFASIPGWTLAKELRSKSAE